MDRFTKTVLCVLFACVCAAAGFAPDAQADEPCLVGLWRATGDGAAAWMARNMPPGLNINVAGHTGFFRFNADGTYQAGASLSETATLQNGGQAATRGPATAQSAGNWQVTDGRLLLTPSSDGVAGAMTVTLPDGKQTTKPFPVTVGGPVSFGVECAGDTLVTSKTFPGIADPLTQAYQRQRGG